MYPSGSGKTCISLFLLLTLFLQALLLPVWAYAEPKEATYEYDEKLSRLTPTDVSDEGGSGSEETGWEWDLGWLENLLKELESAWDTFASWITSLGSAVENAFSSWWGSAIDKWESMPDWLRGLIKGLIAGVAVALAVLAVALALVYFGVIAAIGAAVVLAMLAAIAAGAIYGAITGGDSFNWFDAFSVSALAAAAGAFLISSGFFGMIAAAFSRFVYAPLAAFWAEASGIGGIIATALSRTFFYLGRAIVGPGRILWGRLLAAGASLWRGISGFTAIIARAFSGMMRIFRVGFAGGFGRVLIAAGRMFGRRLGLAFGTLGRGLAGMFHHMARGLSAAGGMLMRNLYRAGVSLWIGLQQSGWAIVTGIARGFAVLRANIISLATRIWMHHPLMAKGFIFGFFATFFNKMAIVFLTQEKLDILGILVDSTLSGITTAIFAPVLLTGGFLTLIRWSVPFGIAGGLEDVSGELLKGEDPSINTFITGYVTSSIMTVMFAWLPDISLGQATIKKSLENFIKEQIVKPTVIKLDQFFNRCNIIVSNWFINFKK